MATSIRQKLYDYIRVAEDRKVKAIYIMLEEEIEEAYDYWNDKNFVAELDKRSADYKSGKVKAVPWELAKAQILSSAKRKKK
jgi:putative addiction module component (TIGR02574 family)